ncbi:MAG: DUF4097 family beta strand repeat protein [Silvibacterium sp.]|nr:DUF4097 family beta strand repeat protein [Silvibacterium sp.]MBV8438049.1 DUF4097 family beta strand repeat protein [Silvibacterium sp.]
MKTMIAKTRIALLLAGAAALAAVPALAQDADHLWTKSYPVSGRPTLNLEIGDAGVQISSCATCREIRIKVETEGIKLSDYRLEESQTQDQIHFLFKEKTHIGVHVTLHKTRTQVTVETPAELTLEARSGDGNVSVSGLGGDLGLTTSDGNVTADHLSGKLRVKSSDGHVKITDSSGSLEARTSDGNLTVDGVFNAVALHTSDGQLEVRLREGTKLSEPSSIQASDGSVTVRVPQGFAADLDVHTSDGHLDCALPLTMDHYDSKDGGGRNLHGKLNGGGTPLTIHTSDGNVKIEQL